MARIVNIRFKCCGLNFDAAVDCDWILHSYGCGNDDKTTTTPVELYCFDHKDWDIRMVFIPSRNEQQRHDGFEYYYHTVVDWDLIIKEAKKWVRENKNLK